MALNAHRVFTGPADADHYLAALTLEKRREDILRAARDACRNAIRSGLRAWESQFQSKALFEAVIAGSAPSSLKPKFRMQGSFAYRTLNNPAQSPPQEIDLDDGVFVPISYLKNNGQVHPALLSSGYFAAVEALLAPVCDRNSWRLITDKPSCVRVEISSDAHIDFALYAIPDEEFRQLVEAEILAKSITAQDGVILREQIEFAEDVYRGLREDQIMLAHRQEGWKPSDPRKLEDWFREALRRHGEQVRRVCRYLKGWRDNEWEACRLSSIALMSCVVTVYDEAGEKPADNRDDLALLAVAERLPALLQARIGNPVVEGQYLDEGWAPDDRVSFIKGAEALLSQLRDSISVTDNTRHALASLIRAFGNRLPDDHTLIKPEEGASIAAPQVLSSGLIKQMGGQQEPQQAVKREGDRRYG
ncbi:CBASS cGAMP synthase [Methylobacterium sp. Gmos1]